MKFRPFRLFSELAGGLAGCFEASELAPAEGVYDRTGSRQVARQASTNARIDTRCPEGFGPPKCTRT